MNLLSDESIITKKGQITIPSKMREEFNFSPGKKVFFVKTEQGIIIKPVVENIRSLRGILTSSITSDAIQNEISNIRKEWTLENE